MHALRWIAGSPIAVLVTLGLFFAMAMLIRQPETGWTTPKPIEKIIITRQITETLPGTVEPPKPIEKEQPPIEIERTPAGKKPEIKAEIPQQDIGNEGPGDLTGAVAAPLIRVAPAYPERCRSKGAEGTVLVQFDVAPDGSVVNPTILESDDACFNRTVLRAVSGWKYPPAYRGGAPVTRYGVIERFSFRLAGE